MFSYEWAIRSCLRPMKHNQKTESSRGIRDKSELEDLIKKLEDLKIEPVGAKVELDKKLKDRPKSIRTQSELDNERLTEIVDAIVRYRKSEMAIPLEWVEEYNTIIERIRNNPK